MPRLADPHAPEAGEIAPLAGKRILITRPREQADRLLERIRGAGGEGVLFPLIEIRDPDDPGALQQTIDRLDVYDLAIFVSPTAAALGLAAVRARRPWPPTLAAAAIGLGTARALQENGLSNVLAPLDKGDSEALLALPDMSQVAGKRIVVFRGQGGRELLAEVLRERGAKVEYAECYRRASPDASSVAVLDSHLQTPLDGIVITSTEALHNLAELGKDLKRARLVDVPLFVPHERIAAAAHQAGVATVVLAPGGDAGLVEGMVKFFHA